MVRRLGGPAGTSDDGRREATDRGEADRLAPDDEPGRIVEDDEGVRPPTTQESAVGPRQRETAATCTTPRKRAIHVIDD